MALANELAGGLPGLPLELGSARVDETGFHRPAGWFRRAFHVPWERVTALPSEDFWHMTVESVDQDGQPAKRIRLNAWWKKARNARVAWREYLLRELHLEAVLRGVPRLHGLRHEGTSALLMAAMFGALLALGIRSVTEEQVVPPEWVYLRLAWLGFYLLFAALLAFWGLANLRAMRRVRRRWSLWELRKGCLAFWPEGDERLLAPSASDILTPFELVIDEEDVRFDWLSHSEVLRPLLLAVGERAGAELRPMRWRWASYLLDAAVIAVGFLLAAWAAVIAHGWEEAYVVGRGVLLVLAGVGIFGCVWYALARRKLRRLLSDGRAMLKRLGW